MKALTIMGGPVEVIELELADKGAAFTPLELRLPESLPLEDWAAIGRRLVRGDQVIRWWLGDWAAFGAGDPSRPGSSWRRHGQLKEFAEANGINYQTLRNLAWVSGRVEMSRRRDKLEWSKHAEVAALAPGKQAEWLEKAESQALPVAELRRQIRQAGGENNALVADGPSTKFVATRALEDLLHWLKGREAGFWEDLEMREVWKGRLEPVVRFWETL